MFFFFIFPKGTKLFSTNSGMLRNMVSKSYVICSIRTAIMSLVWPWANSKLQDLIFVMYNQ